MTMKPSEYKAWYESLEIEGHNATVSVDQYRLGAPKDGKKAANDLLGKVRDKGYEGDVDLKVGPTGKLTAVDKEFTKTSTFRTMLYMPFIGKGAPEHCQLVLQLVKHYKLSTDIQNYANEQLGLDCNGFVGNFVWHVWLNKEWDKHGFTNTMKDGDGPDMSVDVIFDMHKSNRVTAWSEISPTQPCVLVRTDEKGKIITANSGAVIGHVVLTDKDYAIQKATDVSDHFGIRAVESTGSFSPPGLTEGWYTCTEEKNVGSKTNPKTVFKIDRGSGFKANRNIWFAIASIGPQPKSSG